MKMWLTRDDNGERGLWTGKPTKELGSWWAGKVHVCVERDFHYLAGRKCYGVLKGGIAEVDVELKITPIKKK
jgi:hypothetical protein